METAIQPGIYDPAFADRNISVQTEAAYDMARRLAREEGYLVGYQRRRRDGRVRCASRTN